MLVSSFGYLNKNSGMLNGVRVENNKIQTPIVNQRLSFDEKVDNKITDMNEKSANKTKHFDVIV